MNWISLNDETLLNLDHIIHIKLNSYEHYIYYVYGIGEDDYYIEQFEHQEDAADRYYDLFKKLKSISKVEENE